MRTTPTASPRPTRLAPIESRASAGDRIAQAATLAIAAAFGITCLHGIASYWQWGHDGFNGAAFSLAARNSLRFGMLAPAPYYTGLEAPSSADFVVHHPLLLHVHLCVAYALGGSAEWVGRLVPATYSLALLLLVAAVATRLADRATGLAAAAIFALLPIHSIYANMIDHEQGALFWCLAFLWSFERWRALGARRDAAWALGCATLAMQFDWIGYYIAFFVAAWCIDTALSASAEPERVQAMRRFLLALCLVVIANLGAHFLFVASLGQVGDAGVAFASRSKDAPAGYFALEVRRLLDLFGVLPLTLLPLWAFAALRARRVGGAPSLDIVAAAFVYAQIVHTFFFPLAVHNHSYLLYYLGPAVALGGGRALVLAVRRALAWAGQRALARALVVLVVVAATAWQTAFAFRQLRWGYDTGRAAYGSDYDDQFAEIMWARDVARLFPRPRAAFAVDPSVGRRRVEFDSYLDGPIRVATDGRRARSDLPHEVVLLDRAHLQAASRRDWQLVADAHSTWVWDERFVAIDLADPRPTVHRFASRADPAPWWWVWLVHPTHAPQRWLDAPAIASTR